LCSALEVLLVHTALYKLSFTTTTTTTTTTIIIIIIIMIIIIIYRQEVNVFASS